MRCCNLQLISQLVFDHLVARGLTSKRPVLSFSIVELIKGVSIVQRLIKDFLD